MTSLESAWLVIKKAFERAKEKFVKTQVIKWANAYLAIRSEIPLNIYTVLHTQKDKNAGLAALFGENVSNKIRFEVNSLHLTSI